jgi:hypothetical protein
MSDEGDVEKGSLHDSLTFISPRHRCLTDNLLPRMLDAPHPFVSGGTHRRWGGGRQKYMTAGFITQAVK